jgi:NNP family nitrate/nitrite transporter-like MFS transporter
LIAALLLPLGGWRLVIRAIAAATAAGGGAFLLFGSGGREPGDPPRIAHIRPILSQPAFWIIGVLFALAMGAEVGVYSIIPTYLIKEEGMEQQLVNTLLSISRISGLPMIFVTGWLIDRLGIKPLLFGVLSFSGALTALLGAAHQNLLLAAVFLQPVVIICFFPAALAALTDLGSRKSVSLATSLMIPFTYLFGAGLVPALLGILGENNAFSHGFYITGGILLAGLVPLTFLPVPKPDSGTDDAGTAAPGPNAGTVAGSALSETGGAPAEPGTSTSETGDESY